VRHPSTDKQALCALFNIHRTDPIGMVGVAAIDALEQFLRPAVRCRDMVTIRAGTAGIVRWHCDQDAACPVLKDATCRAFGQKNTGSAIEYQPAAGP
jgi:hypothetical protein